MYYLKTVHQILFLYWDLGFLLVVLICLERFFVFYFNLVNKYGNIVYFETLSVHASSIIKAEISL